MGQCHGKALRNAAITRGISVAINRQGPLKGIRVVDLTAMVMGPVATQVMADMGADIIKIEIPSGDTTRYISVGPEPGMSGVFVNTNRGKRSVVLDLKTDDGKIKLRKIIETADVFIHSFRGKAINSLGFSYAEVSAIKPDIVYTNCYGYGRGGPSRDLTAYDDIIQAECGIAALQSMMTGEPGFAATIIADKVSGMTALYATLLALFHRERTGEGQEVEVGMFEAMSAFMLTEHANGAIFTPPTTPAYYQRAVSPNRKPYQTRDGYMAAMVYNDKQWSKFVEAVKPDYGDNPNYATLEKRAAHVDEVYALLGATFLERTTEEWLALFGTLDIPAAPLNTPAMLFENDHLNAVDFFQTVETQHGPVRFPGVAARFSQTPGHVSGPAPTLGEHTDEVLAELGFSSNTQKPD
jgi:crotonobetainyl-CoA:carnitine CoA-transferase CaiB-like acyl-CoA transferase